MDQKYIDILKNNGVGVIPTDTIYGIACSVFNKDALDRIFEIKGRDENKPPVVIISDIKELDIFGIKLIDKVKKFIDKYWPGKVSIIFQISAEYSYLDKGRGLAIRLVNDPKIKVFLEKTGPLATSSANTQGLLPAKNIEEAKKYFGEKVDFYYDIGELVSEPSTLVKIDGDKIEVLRQGVVKTEEF
ncbi:MAG: L-threonylcarbamoyladenylate synthase [Candidatus Paceibacterota bacterium]|jgi:tRNA threonylcarbamoyl adenosine modification protein (Sua5/YciO/YrdC/YwlC family)